MSESLAMQRWQREREQERELEQAGIDPATGLEKTGRSSTSYSSTASRRGRPIALSDRAVRPEGERQRLLDDALALMRPGPPDPVTGSFASEADRQHFDELLARAEGVAVDELPWRRSA